MSPADAEAMWILIGAVGLLLAVIVGVVLKSASRKTHLPPPAETTKANRTATSTETGSSKPTVQAEDDFAPSKSLKQALANTEQSLFGRMKSLWSSEQIEKNFEEIEEVLYTSDLGPQTVEKLMSSVKEQLGRSEKKNMESVKAALKNQFQEIFQNADIKEPSQDQPMKYLVLDKKPAVWMVVGVNGAGKTTSIGKIAAHLARSGKKVLVAAGDTFRAAAGNQLKVWTERAQVEIFSPDNVTDPSAVAFDAVAKAVAQSYDVVIIDTAGRLHTQANLMEELKKMKRVIAKASSEAPHETLIVLDANSGQNALIQAKQFHQALGLTGVVLTKMDGTAKGGVAVGLANELKIPIRLIGVGEKIGDLRAFSAQEFMDSLF